MALVMTDIISHPFKIHAAPFALSTVCRGQKLRRTKLLSLSDIVGITGKVNISLHQEIVEGDTGAEMHKHKAKLSFRLILEHISLWLIEEFVLLLL